MAYHVIFNKEDYNELVNSYLKQGFVWINGPMDDISVGSNDFPLVLNCDNEKTMMVGIIKYSKEFYFSNPLFVKKYNEALRKKKLERILK